MKAKSAFDYHVIKLIILRKYFNINLITKYLSSQTLKIKILVF
jgi:hypothetical protein